MFRLGDCNSCRISVGNKIKVRGEERIVVGGTVPLGKYWITNHYQHLEQGFLGWLIVQPIQHRMSSSELTLEELQEFGVVTEKLEKALMETYNSIHSDDKAEIIYLVRFFESSFDLPKEGDHQWHVHWHMIPRSKSMKCKYEGWKIAKCREDGFKARPTDSEIEKFMNRLKEMLQGTTGPTKQEVVTSTIRQYIFNGRILPERAAVSVNSAFSMDVKVIDPSISLKVTISISVSQVSVVVKTADAIDLYSLKNLVEDMVRMMTDAYGYLEGRGYDVEITSCIDPSGCHTVFGVEIPALEATRSERLLNISELWQLLTIPKPELYHLRLALAELRESIRSPSETGLFCYMAVESIRQYFVRNEDAEKKRDELSWDRLRSELRINENWLYRIKEFADKRRHGGIQPISDSDRTSVMKLTWKVVDRFCVYAHRGFKPLPADEFPVLDLPSMTEQV